MLIAIINKILLVALFLAVLNIIRHLYNLIQTYVTSTTENESVKYLVAPRDLFYLGLSIAYILMTIFNGIVLKVI